MPIPFGQQMFLMSKMIEYGIDDQTASKAASVAEERDRTYFYRMQFAKNKEEVEKTINALIERSNLAS